MPKMRYIKQKAKEEKAMISQHIRNPFFGSSPYDPTIPPPIKGARQFPMPYALLYIPEALSDRNGEFSNPSFSATEAMISGRSGTNKNATDIPRHPIPAREQPRVGGSNPST